LHTNTLSFQDTDGIDIFVYYWIPQQQPPKAAIQIAHGMGETAARYERFAKALTLAGYAVYANDHRGHGLTARVPERVGVTGKDGFCKMTEAMAQLTDLIASRHLGVPVVLFGHSMGSFLVQQYMYRYTDKASGVVLSGTNGRQSPLLWAGIALAWLLAVIKGDDHRSKLLMYLTFGSYNKRFLPHRTASDWLSRDGAEVHRYLADPYCGVLLTAGFFRDFFLGLWEIHRPNRMARIPKRLPIHIFSGDMDPVGNLGKGIRQLVGMYRKLGLERVTYKLYPGGRHEMLNETNRDEVTRDVIAWLDRTVEENK
jgi:alpha-beta hydrolase superfamily lysophospholipase